MPNFSGPEISKDKPAQPAGAPRGLDESLKSAPVAPRDLTTELPLPGQELDRAEKDRRAAFFAINLEVAMVQSDSVKREAGSMTLECTYQSAIMKGGTGENSLHRTDETGSEWVRRVATHWAGFLENNGASLPISPINAANLKYGEETTLVILHDAYAAGREIGRRFLGDPRWSMDMVHRDARNWAEFDGPFLEGFNDYLNDNR